MKTLNKLATAATMMALLMTPALKAGQCVDNSCNTGCAYEDCRKASSITPTVALGVLTLAAVVAVVCMDRSGDHGGRHPITPTSHSHSH